MTKTRKPRSFTLTQPPTSKGTKTTKRSKTFTGCWTCRSRGIKCDEQRPGCKVCLRSRYDCEGYDLKLVWDEEDGKVKTKAKRRTFHHAPDPRYPTLNSQQVQNACDRLDAASDPRMELQIGLFSVFDAYKNRSSVSHDDAETPQIADSNVNTLILHNQSFEITEAWVESDEWSNRGIVDEGDEVGTPVTGMTQIKETILPQLTPYLLSASPDERSLFHYWVTYMSGIMAPAQLHDTPFRTIFIPLALAAPSSPQDSTGSTALLHSIYAISAFNLAERSNTQKDSMIAHGTKHHGIALKYLRKSIMHSDESQREAILASMIVMLGMEVVKGSSTSWRTHLNGAQIWLQSLTQSNPIQSRNIYQLCHIFFSMAAIATPKFTGNPIQKPPMEVPPWIAENKDLADSTFGASLPILKAIIRINALSNPTYIAKAQEIDDLEYFIYTNKPISQSTLDLSCDGSSNSYALVFFYATVIHFERSLRKTPPKELQYWVRQCLDHLEAIRVFEMQRGLEVCGLLWPEFITACEADDENLRSRATLLLEKGKSQGIRNITLAADVAVEVWNRRDYGTTDLNVTWQDTMADLGLDLFLS